MTANAEVTESTIELAAGDLRVVLAPGQGGRIARFDRRVGAELRPILAPMEAGPGGPRLGSFPMVPYSNRIAHGRLATARGWIEIPPNDPRFAHPIHGDGLRGTWAVVARSAVAAKIAFARAADRFWPFAYDAFQEFRLDADGLELIMELRNRAAAPMPAGLGWHPYFPRTPLSRIEARFAGVWLEDAEVLPTERVALPAAWSMSPARPVSDLAVDNCFDGWDGSARLEWPELGHALDLRAAPPIAHAVVFVPPEKDYFCFEPTTHANGAFAFAARGIAGTGAVDLAPGESLIAKVRWTVTPL
ncbi:MAG: aldose 1-epimerase [Alphaproteobacteria bacterium]|nr:aldose 1-epimerase [Alphaproteobacteria bacterium]